MADGGGLQCGDGVDAGDSGEDMSDNELIDQVASIWVDSGGDAEGLAWCFARLQEAIAAEIDRRKNGVMECENGAME